MKLFGYLYHYYKAILWSVMMWIGDKIAGYKR